MTFLPITSFERLDAALETLRDELIPFVGERTVTLFSYAISDASECVASSLHFRRTLLDNGEDPDSPDVTEPEQLRVLLVAFAGQMVAPNLFSTVGRVPLDDSLAAYRKSGDDGL